MSKPKKPILPTTQQGRNYSELKNGKQISGGKEGSTTKGKDGKSGSGGSGEKTGGKGGKSGGKAGGRDSGTKVHPKGVYRIPSFMSGSLVPASLNSSNRKKTSTDNKLLKSSTLPQKDKKPEIFPNRSSTIKRDLSHKNSNTKKVPKKLFLAASIAHLTPHDTKQLYLKLLIESHKKAEAKALQQENEIINNPSEISLDRHTEHSEKKSSSEKEHILDVVLGESNQATEKVTTPEANHLFLEDTLVPLTSLIASATEAESINIQQSSTSVTDTNTIISEPLPLAVNIIDEKQTEIDRTSELPEIVDPNLSTTPIFHNPIEHAAQIHVTNEATPIHPHHSSTPQDQAEITMTTTPVVQHVLPPVKHTTPSPVIPTLLTKNVPNTIPPLTAHLPTALDSSKAAAVPSPNSVKRKSAAFEAYQKLLDDIKALETEKVAMTHQLEKLTESHNPNDSKLKYTTNINIRHLDIKIGFLHKKATTMLLSQSKSVSKAEGYKDPNPILPLSAKKKAILSKDTKKTPVGKVEKKDNGRDKHSK